MRTAGVACLSTVVSATALLGGATGAALAQARAAEPIFANGHLSLDAWQNKTSVCFRYDALGSFGHGCAPLTTSERLNVLWARVGRDDSLMFGTTTDKTRRIVVQLPNGHRVGGLLRVAHLMTKAIDFFVIYVPKQASARGAQTVLTVLAYSADGRLIGRARVP